MKQIQSHLFYNHYSNDKYVHKGLKLSGLFLLCDWYANVFSPFQLKIHFCYYVLYLLFYKYYIDPMGMTGYSKHMYWYEKYSNSKTH